MGQKTHPIGFRLGITKTWKSSWFEKKNYRAYLHEDLQIRRYIEAKLSEAMISNTEIKRVANRTTITIYTARPGVVFGTKRQNLEALRQEIKQLVGRDVRLLVEVVRVPELESKLVVQNIARQLEQRVSHRRAMKRAVIQAVRLGAQGIKVMVSGRLGGREIARSEWYREGRVPLHTLKADIDYYCGVAKTTAGTIGIKVWIYKGDVSSANVMKA
ncbi:30S ribosomal protein S3 [candidate division WOR-3 bacterium JGI_Cruoil_03_51_56]|uniref:Small ribosomal subunit protein uS3 n=1 Tax=candidate division WOR-3 bacterium JGI_Cruoil_03_51_56 TaxID=1973747 RepID=A0A235BW49_UNCW3|nr:MAG: 30S ribosomal protein S3 [candidate division WOR-3 bacterium JGI_Cruoil_03_51_56]